jgi:hypothetical protein
MYIEGTFLVRCWDDTGLTDRGGISQIVEHRSTTHDGSAKEQSAPRDQRGVVLRFVVL